MWLPAFCGGMENGDRSLDAFQDGLMAMEVGEILQEIVNGLNNKDYFTFTYENKMPLLDLNGNTCGYVKITESEEYEHDSGMA